MHAAGMIEDRTVDIDKEYLFHNDTIVSQDVIIRDMKRFRNFKLSGFLPVMIIALAYPIMKTSLSEKKALVFSDTVLLIALFLIIIGVLYHLYLKGDFDAIRYRTEASMSRRYDLPYERYKEEVEEKRKDSFNYPLLCAFVMILLSFIVSLFA